MDYLIEGIRESVRLIFSGDTEIYNIMTLTIIVTVMSTVISSLVGIPLGILVGLRRFRFRNGLIRLIHTLMSLPPVIAGLFVALILSRRGPLGQLQLMFTPEAMVIAQVVLVSPIIIGLVMNGVDRHGRQTLIDARLLGASRWQRFVLLLKEERRSMMTAIATGFGRAISEVGAVMIVGGNIKDSTRVMTTYIAMSRGMGEYEKSLAMGLILLVISFTVNAFLYRQTLGRRS